MQLLYFKIKENLWYLKRIFLFLKKLCFPRIWIFRVLNSIKYSIIFIVEEVAKIVFIYLGFCLFYWFNKSHVSSKKTRYFGTVFKAIIKYHVAYEWHRRPKLLSWQLTSAFLKGFFNYICRDCSFSSFSVFISFNQNNNT